MEPSTIADEELNIAICEWRPETFVIHKPRRGYYLQGAMGYTHDKNLGWIVTKEEGSKYTMYVDSRPGSEAWYDRVVLERVYLNHILGIEALGNMHEAEKGLGHWPDLQTLKYDTELNRICQEEKTNTWSATARQRAIALLHVVRPELFK